jgi:hypothetical protein
MDRRVMIMCDVRASGITGDVADSYFVRVERRASGGVTVLWSDLPDQAMVFDDAAAAAEFCRDGPLEMFVVSFVPVAGDSGPAPAPPLSRDGPEVPAPRPMPPERPPPWEDASLEGLGEPGALSESLRKMGLM